ncbi:hypothetical protein PVK06_031681 [Gossypium arboreum]|uniref:Uncharacterized protein n=1 Tax=Gossypium arboreum TaxID=29729 RepID=A0ABR0NRN5_GOSAR|nr:hypothetical protein PVK06_031681 [Gossypium arboreum]
MEMIFTCALGLTVHEGRIYQLKLFCDKEYPQKPKINMTCVNHKTGMVESKFRLLSNWPSEYTMEDILTQLKKEMASWYNLLSEFREYWETTLMENFYDRKFNIGVGN